MLKRGFVLYDEKMYRFKVDPKETLTLIGNHLLLKKLIDLSGFAKGYLLDIGCGYKPYLHIFNPLVKRYIGIDWPQSLHLSKEIDVYANNQKLPFKDGSIETVLCTEVLEHSTSPFVVMSEITRVLKPEGVLILSVPFLYWMHEEPRDYFRFTRYGLELLVLNSGLEIIRIESRGGMVTVAADFFSKFLQFVMPWAFNLLNIVLFYGLKAVRRWVQKRDATMLEKTIEELEKQFMRTVVIVIQKIYLMALAFFDKAFERWNNTNGLHHLNKLFSHMEQYFSMGYILVARKP
jgi:SAM-dependent methyltransferase